MKLILNSVLLFFVQFASGQFARYQVNYGARICASDSHTVVMFQFDSVLQKTPDLLTWKFSDGRLDTGKICHHKFGIGKHSVTLYALTNSPLYLDSLTKQFEVYFSPNPVFWPRELCGLELTKDTTALHFGLRGTWQWYVDDTLYRASKYPYSSIPEGTHKVNLMFYADNGCKGSDSAIVLVRKSVNARFELLRSQLCPYDTARFVNQSEALGRPDSTLRYVWKFGDGTSDTVRNPIHKYPDKWYGHYLPKLIVTARDNQCQDSFVAALNVLFLPAKDWMGLKLGNRGETRMCLMTDNGDTMAQNDVEYFWTYYSFLRHRFVFKNYKGNSVEITETDSASDKDTFWCTSLVKATGCQSVIMKVDPWIHRINGFAMEKKSEMIVFPNPVSDFVRITFPTSCGRNLMVFSIAGEPLQNIRISGNGGCVYLGSLPSGLYLLKTSDGFHSHLMVRQ